jgi:CRP-like cAMP-binding protein
MAATRPRGLPQGLHGNFLVRSLAPGDSTLLMRHLEPVQWERGETIVSPDVPLTRLIFPETAIIAISQGAVGERRHVGVVGREGMVGWPLLLGSDHSPLLGVAQIRSGTGTAIQADKLREICQASASLNTALLRFVHNFMTQMACTIVSNGTDSIERRVARFLLMLDDRSNDGPMALTHDNVSNALNVRRASVTDCFHILEGEGLLRCTCGQIIVRDRARLEQIAGESYGVTEAHYARHIGSSAEAR